MTRYEMTEEECHKLMKAAATPGVFTGGVLAGYNPARAESEKVWKELGKKYGFAWRSVTGPKRGEGPRVFYATALEGDDG